MFRMTFFSKTQPRDTSQQLAIRRRRVLQWLLSELPGSRYSPHGSTWNSLGLVAVGHSLHLQTLESHHSTHQNSAAWTVEGTYALFSLMLRPAAMTLQWSPSYTVPLPCFTAARQNSKGFLDSFNQNNSDKRHLSGLICYFASSA